MPLPIPAWSLEKLESVVAAQVKYASLKDEGNFLGRTWKLLCFGVSAYFQTKYFEFSSGVSVAEAVDQLVKRINQQEVKAEVAGMINWQAVRKEREEDQKAIQLYSKISNLFYGLDSAHMGKDLLEVKQRLEGVNEEGKIVIAITHFEAEMVSLQNINEWLGIESVEFQQKRNELLQLSKTTEELLNAFQGAPSLIADEKARFFGLRRPLMAELADPAERSKKQEISGSNPSQLKVETALAKNPSEWIIDPLGEEKKLEKVKKGQRPDFSSTNIANMKSKIDKQFEYVKDGLEANLFTEKDDMYQARKSGLMRSLTEAEDLLHTCEYDPNAQYSVSNDTANYIHGLLIGYRRKLIALPTSSLDLKTLASDQESLQKMGASLSTGAVIKKLKVLSRMYEILRSNQIQNGKELDLLINQQFYEIEKAFSQDPQLKKAFSSSGSAHLYDRLKARQTLQREIAKQSAQVIKSSSTKKSGGPVNPFIGG